MEWLAEQRGLPIDFLDQHGFYKDGDHYAYPVPHAKGVWFERTYHPGEKPKYRQPKGQPMHLYNPLGLGPQSDEVWLAEGEFDTLSLVYLGVPAVGILGVGNFNVAWARLFRGARVVLALDPDEAGYKAMDKFSQVFPKADIFEVPEPHSDINDWLVNDEKGITIATASF